MNKNITSNDSDGDLKSPASSPCAGSGAAVTDVPPLGDITSSGSLLFVDEDGDKGEFWLSGPDDGFGVYTSENGLFLKRNQVPSLIAHLQAWLLTGSFTLTPPVSTKIDSGASYVDLSGDKWCPYCGRAGAHFCDKGQTSHPGWSADRPSPEKPLVQPTGSDLERLVDECKHALTDSLTALERSQPNGGPYGKYMAFHISATSTARYLVSKLNA
jgi:hypothetical protein